MGVAGREGWDRLSTSPPLPIALLSRPLTSPGQGRQGEKENVVSRVCVCWGWRRGWRLGKSEEGRSRCREDWPGADCWTCEVGSEDCESGGPSARRCAFPTTSAPRGLAGSKLLTNSRWQGSAHPDETAVRRAKSGCSEAGRAPLHLAKLQAP